MSEPIYQSTNLPIYLSRYAYSYRKKWQSKSRPYECFSKHFHTGQHPSQRLPAMAAFLKRCCWNVMWRRWRPERHLAESVHPPLGAIGSRSGARCPASCPYPIVWKTVWCSTLHWYGMIWYHQDNCHAQLRPAFSNTERPKWVHKSVAHPENDRTSSHSDMTRSFTGHRLR